MGKTTFVKTLSHVFGSESLKTANTVKTLVTKSMIDLWSRSWLVIEEASIGKEHLYTGSIKNYTRANWVDADKKFGAVSKHHIPAQLIMMSNVHQPSLRKTIEGFSLASGTCRIEGTKARQWYFSQYIEWLETDGYKAIAGHLKN